MTEDDYRALLARVYHESIDFDEQRQLLRCRVCGSERGELGRLHRDGCVMRDVFDAAGLGNTAAAIYTRTTVAALEK